MEVTKKQHYVFQSYLKGFSGENLESNKMVWLYDKEIAKNIAPKFPRSVSSICHSLFYYGQEAGGDDIFEKKFQELESKVSPIFKNLQGNKDGVVELSGENRGLLAFMIGLSMTRVPSFRDPIETWHKKSLEIILHNNYLDLEGPSGEEFSQFLDEHSIGINVEQFVSLKPMIHIAQVIGESILRKTWQFYTSPDDISFITSDNPVSFSSPVKRTEGFSMFGPAHPSNEVIFPIRRDFALVCTPKWPESHMTVFRANKQDVKKINRATAYGARKFVISDTQSDALARLVFKNRFNEQTIIFN